MIFNLTTPAVSKLPKFTYTGTYELINDGGKNWRIKFLTSGIFTPSKNMSVDIFLVGGGGGGRNITGSGGGGGGGYTSTIAQVTLIAGTAYTVAIGAGGGNIADGGNTSFDSYSAAGGKSPGAASGGVGGAGGSGGGGYITRSPYTGYAGGSDGSDGVSGGGSVPGTGQGTTTREFGEATGDLYAGGGGGNSGYSGTAGAGGAGGGGAGGQSGTVNTGGGAGGGSGDYTITGGSGIVIIRNARG